MRFALAAALLAVATPALADITAGTVYAFDEKMNVLVMSDRTIWQLGANTVLPDTIGAGDKIVIDFTSAGDDGVVSVDMISQQPESGA